MVQKWSYRRHVESSRKWPVVIAKVEVASTFQNLDKSDHVISYTGALNYFYHHPNLETGEFQRGFELESQAKEWVESYKGRSVNVHVNPKDASESYLLRSELPEISMRQTTPLEILQKETKPQLSALDRLSNHVAILLNCAGLTLCFFLLYQHYFGLYREWRYWLMGICAGCALVSVIISSYLHWKMEQEVSSDFQLLKQTFTPQWIRISIRVIIPLSAIYYVLFVAHEDLPDAISSILMAHKMVFFVVFGSVFFMGLLSEQIALERVLEHSDMMIEGSY